ncbi:hypothetical protein D4R52_00780 [bacterium]|nr:MAG: hypothetical protein D4R52_00780 [bacterium]
MLNKSKFSFNVAWVSGAVYAVCAAFVALFPGLSLRLMSNLSHLDLAAKFGGEMRVTFGGFVSGLIQVMVYLYVIARLFAWVFNKSAEGEKKAV